MSQRRPEIYLFFPLYVGLRKRKKKEEKKKKCAKAEGAIEKVTT